MATELTMGPMAPMGPPASWVPEAHGSPEAYGSSGPMGGCGTRLEDNVPRQVRVQPEDKYVYNSTGPTLTRDD